MSDCCRLVMELTSRRGQHCVRLAQEKLNADLKGAKRRTHHRPKDDAPETAASAGIFNSAVHGASVSLQNSVRLSLSHNHFMMMVCATVANCVAVSVRTALSTRVMSGPVRSISRHGDEKTQNNHDDIDEIK